ncbi:MAG: sugar-binding domain-containing protein, partial [Steroidobacteraceae bacterium]
MAEPVAATKDLEPRGAAIWALGRWRLTAAPGVQAGGAQLSMPGYDDSAWYAAVVPGTVLTTLIARGVYPDPNYGLNNLAIPDSLSRQDYWYRSVFSAPADLRGKELTLTFKGINYAAEVWLNGTCLGDIKGAFIRGVFDVTGRLRPGETNVLAVRVSPPPHPGIPHEQSIAAGPGENGGSLAIDGPTFIATEGWDWIPGIRDRNTGIWQEVELAATGKLRLLDPHVVTRLPLPRTDAADISIAVGIENRAAAAVQATLVARFGAVEVRKTLTLSPGVSEVSLDPQEFPQLHLAAPRLWWPNGYGPANLYALDLEVLADGERSDSLALKFGVRELTYELSLFDSQGRLRRVEVDPAAGSALGQRLIDVRHEAIKRTPRGWAESLTPAGETSPAVRPIATESLTPYLVIRVNGVPIAARGGSWGMDDSRKRISRERLEPYFRLHRAAHLNIIRNWLGQDTEDVFYDLADEYGLLVLNDFWESTQDFQVEAQDPALFLANARDVISRYRNHPSIAVWFGRNEGVPQPIINEGLADLTAALDGTRYYTGSSNSVNLQGSGPYNYRPPEQYFTQLAQGFSVEVGTPSLATLESLRASIPAADRWPLSDTYAYHDWHFGGNGDVATFMAALAEQYGAATNLEDFE